MSEKIDIAYKFGCGRYRQEKGLIAVAGEEIKRYGKKAFIIGGPTALGITSERLCRSLRENNIDYELCEYKGHCSYTGADRIGKLYADSGCDMIVGVGGGRIMDFSQLVASNMQCPVINIPTSSATCAAYTTLSVLYDDSGKTIGNFYQRYELNAVLVDTEIMVKQPKRLLMAGYMDALAKYIEMKNGRPDIDTESMNMDVFTAGVLAKHTYENLTKLLPDVLDALAKGEVTDDLEKFIYLVIPVTGIISGISKGFGQSAIGHEFYYCMRTLFTEETLTYLHGEVVAIGLLAQSLYNKRPDEAEFLKGIMETHGMPVKLSGIGIDPTDENFQLIYDLVLKSPFVTDDGKERFYSALREVM